MNYQNIYEFGTMNCDSIEIIKQSNKNNKETKMAIVRFNPVRDLLNVEREFNRMFKSMEDRFGLSKKEDVDDEYENAVWMPLTDIYEDKNDYKIKADLPGIKKDDVKISFYRW